MRRIPLLLATVLILLGLARPARAQAALQVSDVHVDYAFGQEVVISARLNPPGAVQSVSLWLQVEGESQARSFPLAPAADGSVRYELPLQSGALRPFANVTFWFECGLVSGGAADSPQYFFTYTDNRPAWQTAGDAGLRVHWYDGDAAFGQTALQAARTGLESIRSLIPIEAGKPIDVYVYASAQDVQEALGLTGLTWVSGHASPDLGVVLVSVAPGSDQSAELQDQIPHELAHVLLYRMTGAAYNGLPTWLREGLASLAGQAPGAQQLTMLKTAGRNKALLPMADLCGLFPQDASGAGLAYAESASFTRWLHSVYGTTGLQELIRAYAEGKDCSGGVELAYGLPLSQLDLRWQQQVLGKDEAGIALENMLPYLAILIAILMVPAWYIFTTLRSRREKHGR